MVSLTSFFFFKKKKLRPILYRIPEHHRREEWQRINQRLENSRRSWKRWLARRNGSSSRLTFFEWKIWELVQTRAFLAFNISNFGKLSSKLLARNWSRPLNSTISTSLIHSFRGKIRTLGHLVFESYLPTLKCWKCRELVELKFLYLLSLLSNQRILCCRRVRDHDSSVASRVRPQVSLTRGAAVGQYRVLPLVCVEDGKSPILPTVKPFAGFTGLCLRRASALV